MAETEAFIYLAKENNVSSEQIFILSFQRTDSVPLGSDFAIAQEGMDYIGIGQEFTQPFGPNDQCLCLTVTLLTDRNPEPTEAFQINTSPQSLPTFNSPNVLFSRTFVMIEDNDYQSKCKN